MTGATGIPRTSAAPRAVVVGAGLAGLSAACHLRGAGLDVTVLERGDAVGGLAATATDAGFTFDLGPTVLTMPELIDTALQAVGSRLEDELRVERLDPAYRATFVGAPSLTLPGSVPAIRREIEQRCGAAEAAGFDRFVEWVSTLYETEMPSFIDRNVATLGELLARPVDAARLLRLGGLRRLGPKVGTFFEDERLRRLFTFQALYAGMAPQDALAIYAVIAYMDSIAGVYAAEGGMSQVPASLARALTRAGGQVCTGVTVTGIERGHDGRVTGARTADGGVTPADVVVATGDIERTYTDLLPDVALPRSLRRASRSPSAVVLHLGVRGTPPPGTAHHNIHFGRDWEGAFSALIDDRTLMPDPSRLVSVPSISDPSLAPPGCTTLYVLEPVPHQGSGIDWADEGPRMRDRLLTALDEHGYPTDVVTEHLTTPADWEAQGLTQGTPFALAHSLTQTGPFRPANRDRRVPGLFLAGAGTTPGVGVPMVLVSGRLAAERAVAHVRGRT